MNENVVLLADSGNAPKNIEDLKSLAREKNCKSLLFLSVSDVDGNGVYQIYGASEEPDVLARQRGGLATREIKCEKICDTLIADPNSDEPLVTQLSRLQAEVRSIGNLSESIAGSLAGGSEYPLGPSPSIQR